MRALLHFVSFKNKNRPIVNEFGCEDNKTLNPEVLKTNWYRAADFLIRRFVKQNKSHPMCNITTADFTELPQPEIIHKLINTKIENKIALEEKESNSSNKNTNYRRIFCFVPITVDVLHTILNTKSKVFEKVLQMSHNCIVPLNTGSHWVVLFFCGIEQQVYYLNSFGNPPNKSILNIVNKKCPFWKTQYNQMKVQFDSYQCGVWCSFFVAVCVDYLNKIQEKTDMNTKHDFMNFFSQTLNSKKIIISTDNKVHINNEFSKSLRISTISKINSSITENSMEIQEQLPQHSTKTQFFQEKFPAHIKFSNRKKWQRVHKFYRELIYTKIFTNLS